MAAKMSVLGLIMSFPPYPRSAMVRFPFVFDLISLMFPAGTAKKLSLLDFNERKKLT